MDRTQKIFFGKTVAILTVLVPILVYAFAEDSSRVINFASKEGLPASGPLAKIFGSALSSALLQPSSVPISTNPPVISSAVNLASGEALLAPGTLATIFGSNLSSTLLQPSSVPLSIFINGLAGAVLASTPQQLTVQLPVEAQAGAAVLQVQNQGLRSAPYSLRLDSYAPGIFTANGNLGSIWHFDDSAVSNSNPAQPGEAVSLLATGLGPTNPFVATGAAAPRTPRAMTLITPSMTIGGQLASVQQAILEPSAVGIYRVFFSVPLTLSPGNYSLSMRIGDQTSNSAILAVGGQGNTTLGTPSTPIVTYGTYFSGTGDDAAVAVALGPSGEIIVAGTTTSPSLPGTANAWQPTKATGFPNNSDVFIAKFDSSGRTLQWATFLGGDGNDIPTAVAVDRNGSIYVTGTTQSSNFPVSPGAYGSGAASGQASSFASKLSADGGSLLYSAILPGIPRALAVNDAGELYIAGQSNNAFSFVTTGALRESSVSGPTGLFLLRLNSTATGLVFGADLGGGGFNGSNVASLAIDPEGDIYLAGTTAEPTIPTTGNAFQRQYSNAGLINSIGPGALDNGFIIEVNSAGSLVLYGTYFGPRYFGTSITSVALVADGSLYLSGPTNATTLQATTGAYLDAAASGYIAKLTPGSPVLDSFSFLPDRPLKVAIGNGPQTVHVLSGAGVIELTTPALGLVSSFATPSFGARDFVLAPMQSIWLVGRCNSCSTGGLITSNAFQSQSNGSGGAVLIQLTNILPSVSFVGSSATLGGPFSAGQLIRISGSEIGPAVGSLKQVDTNGIVTTLAGGTRVLFDGFAAPVLFARADAVDSAIPCSLVGRTSTQMVIEYDGAQSTPLTIQLDDAAPGIFTVAGDGRGQAAILNDDYSVNGPANPAARGSAATLYATGFGATSPACIDGKIYQDALPVPALPVIVGINNQGVQVLYAGQAPDNVSGVIQVDILIPDDAPSGPAVPIALQVGSHYSPSGVTIAIK